MLSLRNVVGVPSTHSVPTDFVTFFFYILPPLLCHFVVAVLAVMPRTRTIRVALLPLVLLLVLRAALTVDTLFGKIDVGLFLWSVAGRTLDLALVKGPLVRHLRPTNSSPSIIMDALDLVSNHRGLGWDWSRYQSYTPRQTRPAHRITFVFYASVSAVAHALICGAFHRAVLTLAPVGAGPVPNGSTIFDETLPFIVRYLRASIISIFAAFTIYAGAQMCYDLLSIPAILLLGQNPVQWPPAFDAPWLATSLSDFWGRRWHQWPRRTFLILGGYPLSLVLGRTGTIIGTFLASGIMHHFMVMKLNSQLEIWYMLVGFGMMAPGMLAERAFHRLTGRMVSGIFGWVWTMAWLLLWGNLIVEGLTKAGTFGYVRNVDSGLPVQIPVEHLAAGLDAWLHTN